MDVPNGLTILEAPAHLPGSPCPPNVLTIDIEDWYQGLEIPCDRWHAYEDRMRSSCSELLELLDECGTKATCFMLGKVAETHPSIGRMIADAGHEIATHGYSHSLVFKLSRSEFEDEIDRSVKALEDSTGCKVIGHRAPYFSINRDCIWALEVLAERGFVYDSSIFPIHHYRYNWTDAPTHPFTFDISGQRLIELPISTLRVFGVNVPMFGGAYLRIFPRSLVHRMVKLLNKRGIPAVIYAHNWELDPKQPRIGLPFRLGLPHYWRLGATEGKLRKILRKHKFGTARDLAAAMQAIETSRLRETSKPSGSPISNTGTQPDAGRS